MKLSENQQIITSSMFIDFREKKMRNMYYRPKLFCTSPLHLVTIYIFTQHVSYLSVSIKHEWWLVKGEGRRACRFERNHSLPGPTIVRPPFNLQGVSVIIIVACRNYWLYLITQAGLYSYPTSCRGSDCYRSTVSRARHVSGCAHFLSTRLLTLPIFFPNRC